MSSSSRRIRGPEQSNERPAVRAPEARDAGRLSSAESARLKQEIAQKGEKISQLVQKAPEKAAKILSDWINRAQSNQNSTQNPKNPPLRRKPG